MSQCVVPKRNLKAQRQEEEEEEEEEEEGNKSSDMVNPSNSHLVSMPYDEVAELTWENGQLAIHRINGVSPTPTTTKPTWVRSSDTLESIVHQAASHNQVLNLLHHDCTLTNRSSIAAASSSLLNLGESSARLPFAAAAALLKKQAWTDSDQCENNPSDGGVREDRADRSACGSAAAVCRDNDTTMAICVSYESPRSLKTKATDEDSASHDGSETRHEAKKTRGETCRSNSTRRSRAAAVHNLSERRRRDRINQKMKTLQKLVPNAIKTDKASMLDEVIEYLKQLQAQVQMMSMRGSNTPQMMVPLGFQPQQQQQPRQHLQMSSLLAKMGIGVGLGIGVGMLDIDAVARDASQPLLLHHHHHPLMHHPSPAAVTAAPTPSLLPPPPFVAAQPMIPPCVAAAQAITSNATSNASAPLPDTYCAFLSQQSLNVDLYSKSKTVALYGPQTNQTAEPASSNPSRSSHENQDAK